MLDQIIPIANDVERSLAFYEAAFKPLDIRLFLEEFQRAQAGLPAAMFSHEQPAARSMQ